MHTPMCTQVPPVGAHLATRGKCSPWRLPSSDYSPRERVGVYSESVSAPHLRAVSCQDPTLLVSSLLPPGSTGEWLA